MQTVSLGIYDFANMLLALLALMSVPLILAFVVSVMCRDVKEEPAMTPDERRVVAEYEELSARLDRLYAQLETKEFQRLDSLEQDRRRRQAAYMHAYQLTLMERIANFETEGNA